MTPSAPIPARRSVRRRTWSAVTPREPSRSGTSTKSFSVPWPLVKCSPPVSIISPIVAHGTAWRRAETLELSAGADDVERALDQVRVVIPQPVDARVGAEPRLLAPGEPAGRGDRVLDRLLGAEGAVEVCKRLAVAESPARCSALTQAGRVQTTHLFEQARVPHLMNPGIDTCVELRPRDQQAYRDGGQQVLPGRQGGREGPPGELDDLEGPYDAPLVPRLNRLRCNRIRPVQARMHGRGSLHRELTLQPGTNRRVGRRDVEAVENCADVQARTAHHDWPVPAGADACDVQACFSLVCRNAGFLLDVQDIELMVGDPPARFEGHLGGADVHAPIELQGVGVHDLATQSLGKGKSEIRLAARCRPHDRDD